MNVNNTDTLSSSESLLFNRKRSPPIQLSRHASLALRLTLTLLGLWKPDADKEASKIHHDHAHGNGVSSREDNGYQSIVTIPEEDRMTHDKRACETCVMDISRIPLCEMKPNYRHPEGRGKLL